MKNLTEIKAEKQLKVDAIIKNSLMFFAFSNDQFNENKTQLQEGEKYVSLGAGCYMPKSKVEGYLKAMKEVNQWFKATVKENKARTQHIAYEINNHEAYYTGDIEDAMSALGSDYTKKEVLAVYNVERLKQEVF